MTFPVKAKALLTALANYLNQPITLIGDEPLASVLIGHCKIVFSLSEGGQYLLSQATVTKLPTDTRRDNILRALAASNYSSGGEGGILGLEKESGLIWLTYRFWLEREKPESFLKSLAIQTGLAEYWLKTIVTSPDAEYPMI